MSYEPEYCDFCYEELTSSHYHCSNCLEESGMYGHYNMVTKEFSCTKVEREEDEE